MGHIFKEKGEVPIPEHAHINHSNAEVSIYELDNLGKRTGVRRVIGRAATDSTMYVNSNFRLLFPELWKQHFNEEPKQTEVSAGLYAAALGIGSLSGLYPMMVKIFGVKDANAVMDYAVYQISNKSSAVQPMQEAMRSQVAFSDKLPGDSFYSEMFTKRLAAKGQDHEFRLQWLEYCAEHGTDEVWLCIDGSNSDARITNSNPAEPGAAKSHKSVPIVSCIWAVCAKTGLPVCWMVNNGGMHDSKAFHALLELIGNAGIKIRGVIIDRGFASKGILETIKSWDYAFILMLPQSAAGYKTMMERHASEIFWNGEYWFFLNGHSAYGTADHVKLFNNLDDEYCTALFFDSENGPAITNHVTAKIGRAIGELEEKLKANPDKAEVPKGMEKYLRIERRDGSAGLVIIDRSQITSIARTSGFSAIASSEELSPKEIAAIYDLRDQSEKQFADFKTQLGAGVIRVHSDSAVKSRMLSSFIAAILHRSLINACRELSMPANVMTAKLNRVRFILNNNDKFMSVKELSSELEEFLAKFGINQNSLEVICAEYNARQSAVHREVRELPNVEIKPRGPGRPRKSNPEAKEPKTRGRPKGSRNKSTLEREARERAAGIEPAPKRGPGRPKGSRNKKTLERERLMREQGITVVKRKPGRPKGSKNKKTLAREAEAAANRRKAELRNTRKEGRSSQKAGDKN